MRSRRTHNQSRIPARAPLVAAGIFALLGAAAPPTTAGELKAYESKYYIIQTDVPPDAAREALLRMTKMAEVYHERTREFAGDIKQRLPFYLYSNPDDFYVEGVPKNSAGYFNGTELVALAKTIDARTWHTVQHEGFHQFAHFVIRGELATWLDEGLAEYFGEAVFTGDGMISGVIPQWRLARVRESFRLEKFRPLSEMMELSLDEWNSKLSLVNYDQGWAMVQFLAHGENGKYQRAFGAFLSQVGKGKPWHEAWDATFGSDMRGFETRWRAYWTSLPDDPTAELYAQATLATWTSFMVRANLDKQSYADFESFVAAARHGDLPQGQNDDWLPSSLLSQAIEQTREMEKSGYRFSVSGRGTAQELVCSTPGGTRIIGKFSIRNGRVASVSTEIRHAGL